MDGSNFRRVLFCLVLVSGVCVISLAIIIWILVDNPNCSASLPITSAKHDDGASNVQLEDLELDVTSGDLLIKLDGRSVLSGKFDNILHSKEHGLKKCSSNAKTCLQRLEDGYKIIITSYALRDTDNSPYCYTITQTLPLSADNNVTTCFDYLSHHWYGAAEVHDQHWPIEKWSIDLQEFVTRDPYHPGWFGSVQERYWLSSAGVGIHVPFKVPLYVSMNASNDQKMCFVSKYQNSVYHNIDEEDIKLTFDVCTAKNITALHIAMAEHFWEKPSGRPHLETLIKPIWSTWAIYKKNINADALLEYADRILRYNLSISQLEIDDDWTPHYGDWTFSTSKFPDAVKTMSDLKQKIPAISIWIHPFINIDSDAFKYTADQNMLMIVRGSSKPVPGLTTWWNPGYAGLLDFSNDNSTLWFLSELENLKQNYSIDSFKFDAGEIVWMPKHTDLLKPYFHPSEYIKYYVEMAVEADKTGRRQEVRVGCLTQDAPILVRMLDRRSRWGIDNGLKTLIPTALTFGLIGYPFVLPDMIGGNAYDDVVVDKELYIRWLQINVFLPAIQFSIPPWYFNDTDVIHHTKAMLTLRESYTSLFDKLSNESVTYGWPMVRPLWWVCPEDSACQSIDDQFLLGNDLVVAPIVEQNSTNRDIYLPAGIWIDKLRGDGELQGGKWYRNYSASLLELPYFVRKQ